MGALWQDLRYGLRMLVKNPGFTAVALLTLALGIGANTTMFSMVNGVLIRPLAFKDPNRLYTLWERNVKMGYEQNPPATANFRDWRERNRVFEQMAAFDSSRTFNLAGSGSPERVDGAAVSPGLFELLGVEPSLGRTKIPLVKGRYFQERDGAQSARVLIINEAVARNVFPKESPIGKRLRMGSNGFTGEIVGVVGDTRTLALDMAPIEELYTPYLQLPSWNTMTLAVRTASAPLALSRSVRALV